MVVSSAFTSEVIAVTNDATDTMMAGRFLGSLMTRRTADLKFRGASDLISGVGGIPKFGHKAFLFSSRSFVVYSEGMATVKNRKGWNTLVFVISALLFLWLVCMDWRCSQVCGEHGMERVRCGLFQVECTEPDPEPDVEKRTITVSYW